MQKMKARERSGMSSEKVLIVEDEVHARTGLTELIESWGYRAECAADGIEGLERAMEWAPAIIVTDGWRPLYPDVKARFASVEEGAAVTVDRLGYTIDHYTIYLGRGFEAR